MSFQEFSIDPRLLDCLDKQGIDTPTPVQAESIPFVLDGRDLMAGAQTGTGKTLAFALPALTRLAPMERRGVMMLVMTPTRELAVQVHSVIEPLAKKIGVRTACVYGGAGMTPQTNALRRGANVVIATPGRLLDHISRGNLWFNKLQILVLDEADRMLDMGFLPDIKRILTNLPRQRQTLMFSATLPKTVMQLAASMQQDPERIQIGTAAAPADTVRQGVYTVAQATKLKLLSDILHEPEVTSALVFMRTKRRTDSVARSLHQAGFKVQAIHGDRPQRQRQQALEGFRDGRYTVLVATDVAARGLDIAGVSHVINYDVPKTSEEYVHRIGRTGRASNSGDAITFVSPDEFMELRAIEHGLGKNLPRKEWAGAVPVVSLYTPESEAAKSGGLTHKPRRGRSLLRRR
jgi:ATP-dependent RNA helicase RhlE